MMHAIPHAGYMIDGHDVPRAEALAQVRAALIEAGMSAADADEATVDRPGLVARAWWAGDGFVQEHHDGAEPVTVVNIAPPGVAQ